MLTYHMGWEGEGAGIEARGKRIRPALVLLSCSATGGDWHSALPAAAAVEFLHNFSLVHDDIQDNSDMRRGRPTVWVKWGIAQAINTGDLLFTLANKALLRLRETSREPFVLDACAIFQEACRKLTYGQHLDISFETQKDVSPEAYWLMVSGKTAALLSACCEIGALLGGADANGQSAFCTFGENLGLAFQAQDDILGIWGDAARIGKSTESDLVTGKKTLPVLYGDKCGGAFAARWRLGSVTPAEVPELVDMLEDEGVRATTQADVDRLTADALGALEEATPNSPGGEALFEMAHLLIDRNY
jgi:geranylgeranyl diphosphate synthase type I